MRRNRWLVLAGLVVVGSVGGGLWWRSNRNGDATETTQTTAVVTRGTLKETVGGSGTLVAPDEHTVSFTSSGKVAAVMVAEGDLVAEGQALAVMDTRDLELSLESARTDLLSSASNLESAKTSLAALLAGPDDQDKELAKLSLERAKNSLWSAQINRDSTCGAYKEKRAQKVQCEAAEASVLSAEGSVRSAQIESDQALEPASAEETAAARAKVASAQAQYDSAKNKVAQAELALDEATLTSPITGTVMTMNVTLGETTDVGGAGITVADLSNLNVSMYLDETDIGSVQTEQEATITLDAFSDRTFTGKVTLVSPVASTSSGVVMFPVTVGFDVGDVPARPGMTAEVDIVTKYVEDALIVPLKAINTTAGGTYVVRVAQAGDASAADSGAVADAAAASGGSAASFTPGAMPFRTPGAMGGRMRGTPGAWPRGTPGARPFGTPPAGGFAARDTAAFATVDTSAAVPVPVTVGLTTTTQAQILEGLSEGDVIVVPTTTTSASTSTESETGGFERGPGGMPMDGGFFVQP
jgi:HlyD family secretion protein